MTRDDDGQTQYVCTSNDTPEIAKAFSELREFQERRDQQGEFLKKQVQALEEENKKRWEELWDRMKDAGKVPREYRYKDFSISLNGPGWNQIFITPSKGGGGLLNAIMKQIIE